MNRIFGPGSGNQVEGEPFDVSKPNRRGVISLIKEETAGDELEKGEMIVVVNLNCSVRGQRYAVWHYRPDGWLDPM